MYIVDGIDIFYGVSNSKHLSSIIKELSDQGHNFPEDFIDFVGEDEFDYEYDHEDSIITFIGLCDINNIPKYEIKSLLSKMKNDRKITTQAIKSLQKDEIKYTKFIKFLSQEEDIDNELPLLRFN